jgi:hypothetical protein
MKKITLTICGLALVVLAIAQQIASNSQEANTLAIGNAVFNWSTTSHDFGKITMGVPVTHEFTFINTGEIPLIISSVQASCGCTVTSYSKDPIAPGSEGFVRATYNAAKPGQFNKTLNVNANTEQGVVQLSIQGEVIE